MDVTLSSRPVRHLPRAARGPRWVVHELLARQRALTIYAAVLLLLVVPALLAAGVDDRVLRGANVWIKPIKFLLSIALLALTTAWFVGHLPLERRGSAAVRWIVALVIGAGSFELVYIALQAARGEGSHYNVGDPLHATMYTLMGIGAVALTASQPLLAWQLWRHPDPAIAPAYRRAVVLGLVLTFVLGAGVGAALSSVQPPTGPSLPFVGWSTVGGDLRPAHFVGVHAGQLLPVAGLALARLRIARGERWMLLLAAAYAAGCVALAMQALGAAA